MVNAQLATDKENVRATAGARPTLGQQGSQLQTMVIHDEDRGAWPKGRYRFVVRCVGQASLVAHFSLDATSAIKELPPCSPSGTVDQLEVTIGADAHLSKVVIVPAGQSMAAVGYAIQRAA